MRAQAPLSLAPVLVLALLAAVGTANPPAASAEEDKEPPPVVLVGSIDRPHIEEVLPDWVKAEVDASLEPAAAKALASVPPGARVTVFLGTWCGDSAREVPRLWRALDEAGGSVPFEVSYVGVDHDKKEPGGRPGPADVRYVPTFIVERDGREVGRIVESAPHGIERDLLSLLDGSAHGILSGRDDLGSQAPPSQP